MLDHLENWNYKCFTSNSNSFTVNDRNRRIYVLWNSVNGIYLLFNLNIFSIYVGVIHKGRPHRGGSEHSDTCGQGERRGGGIRGRHLWMAPYGTYESSPSFYSISTWYLSIIINPSWIISSICSSSFSNKLPEKI